MTMMQERLDYRAPGVDLSEGTKLARVSAVAVFAVLVLVIAGSLSHAPGTLATNRKATVASNVDLASAKDAQPVLEAPLQAALDFTAQRYRVSPNALKPIFAAARESSKGLDPLLIIAVIGIESGFNPLAQSVMGAQGLMQVIPRYHREKLPPESGEAALLDPVANVHVGAQVLQEAIRRQGGLIEGLQYYAGASDDPDKGYSAKVLAEKQKLEQAIRARKIVLALGPETPKTNR